MAASQRVRSRVPAPQRSILPSVPGIPAGAAVLIAVACTFLGFLVDANGDMNELTGTFATLYVVGCVAAVLAVRYRGLFSTMVLPPLLMVVAVPLAYQQLAGSGGSGIKDLLLNLAVPLVYRFPTMLLATALVLLIGGLRIYLFRREQTAESAAESRRGSSWGRTSGTSRSRTKRGEALSDSSKRRPRRSQPEPDDDLDLADQKTDKYLPPRPGKRTSGEVADAPPRVGKSGRARDGRAGRTGRSATPRSDNPPLPRPNVRYRERDSSRGERRKPENL
ncbi:DUF6542 domain-containing protein [Nocardia goodfellowii]|uniref:DUF6542 domain-containing protein n=1 Tax=Nocardia goodfellowii TaxID=882446 RepID=A0ABS4QC03_9NOCA|nr:DUF6542 domain-containing protein [Nocardia goodfellowii]MBP2189212.1 hypothetical protein [Nocardia goodfellowii]